ncbi:MAG: hypothetical protein OXE99_04320 [Cellvibrionales bacterium]|nr:hypothetical protein [Cellvibrionales bacterium]
MNKRYPSIAILLLCISLNGHCINPIKNESKNGHCINPIKNESNELLALYRDLLTALSLKTMISSDDHKKLDIKIAIDETILEKISRIQGTMITEQNTKFFETLNEKLKRVLSESTTTIFEEILTYAVELTEVVDQCNSHTSAEGIKDAQQANFTVINYITSPGFFHELTECINTRYQKQIETTRIRAIKSKLLSMKTSLIRTAMECQWNTLQPPKHKRARPLSTHF